MVLPSSLGCADPEVLATSECFVSYPLEGLALRDDVVYWPMESYSGVTHQQLIKPSQLRRWPLKHSSMFSSRTPGCLLFQFLTLPCLYILSCLMFAKNNLHLFPFNSSIHGHYTRQNSNIHLYDHSFTLSLKAPQHSISQIYNKLLENIKGCLSNKSFKLHAIKLLTQKAY
ncbi:hypothetical protein J437_LFUL013106 [Ladona fulva]|uniref:Uncharacterized protein n=1 Tax=Ladona fulva TaxID=123851 RepID=A0A8K0KGL7_LADFU|nr:hypothetical protein J437_LFUL013106 [Ladona fulva]